MADPWSWILAAAGIVITLIGGIMVRDRQVMSTIKAGDDTLHERVNRTRDEYVRRDDLDNHIRRIEKSVEEMRVEMREQRRTNERLDATLTSHTGMMQSMMSALTRLVEREGKA